MSPVHGLVGHQQREQGGRPRGYTIEHALRFQFSTTNNVIENEAVLRGLRMAEAVGVTRVRVNLKLRNPRCCNAN